MPRSNKARVQPSSSPYARTFKLPTTPPGATKKFVPKDDKVAFDLWQPFYQSGPQAGGESPNKYLKVLSSFTEKDEFNDAAVEFVLAGDSKVPKFKDPTDKHYQMKVHSPEHVMLIYDMMTDSSVLPITAGKMPDLNIYQVRACFNEGTLAKLECDIIPVKRKDSEVIDIVARGNFYPLKDLIFDGTKPNIEKKWKYYDTFANIQNVYVAPADLVDIPDLVNDLKKWGWVPTVYDASE